MKLTIFSGILLLSLVGPFSQATITISSIEGASRSIINPTVTGTTTTTTPQIFGGGSGENSVKNFVAGTTCTTCANTCAAGAVPSSNLAACNLNAVTATTQLQINFTSTTASGNANLCDGTTPIGPQIAYTAGSIGQISIPWGTICGDLGCDAGTSETKTYTLGIGPSACSFTDQLSIQIKYSNMDADLTANPGDSISDGTNGPGDFILFPGDEKAYVTELVLNASITNFTLIDAVAFYADLGAGTTADQAALTAASLASVTNTSPSSQMPVNASNQLIDNRIMGLNNDELYVFRFAVEDDCGNIGFFTKDVTEAPAGILTFDPTKHAVIPQQVFGLLEKNQNCFITTAAYGSPLDKRVMTFKKFRDQILKQYSLGRSFIDFYYAHSPKWADKIRTSETARAITRFFLWPLWAMAVISLKIGFWTFLSLLGSLIFALVLVKKKYFHLKYFLIFGFIFLASFKTHAQDDNYFDLQDDSTNSTQEKETAPQEPPYTGTEDEEFKEVQSADQPKQEKVQEESPGKVHQSVKEKVEAKQEAEFQENYNAGETSKNPNKWKPYSRVPEEEQLKKLSDEGLFKITKKGEYLYTAPVTPQNQAASLRFGVASFPSLHNSGGISFQDIYGSSQKPMLMADYEWQFFKSAGKLALKFGSGLMIASGNGRFANPVLTPSGTTNQALEKYNFFMFPNSLAMVYRLDIFPHQWLVPFIEGGADYFTFFELRDDARGFKFGGSPLAHFAVGGSFLLDVIDRDAISDARQEYGVSHMWLTAEYRRFQNLGAAYDFSDNIFDAGVMFDF